MHQRSLVSKRRQQAKDAAEKERRQAVLEISRANASEVTGQQEAAAARSKIADAKAAQAEATQAEFDAKHAAAKAESVASQKAAQAAHAEASADKTQRQAQQEMSQLRHQMPGGNERRKRRRGKSMTQKMPKQEQLRPRLPPTRSSSRHGRR